MEFLKTFGFEKTGVTTSMKSFPEINDYEVLTTKYAHPSGLCARVESERSSYTGDGYSQGEFRPQRIFLEMVHPNTPELKEKIRPTDCIYTSMTDGQLKVYWTSTTFPRDVVTGRVNFFLQL